ncbi:MAG: TAXI family TRAP transporter solute-binding subunit, partial [Planctomycetota bacterium]
MRRARIWLALALAIVAVVAVVAAVLLASGGGAPPSITIATGFKGGTYYPIGSHIAQLLSERDPGGFEAEAIETRGSTDNIGRLLDGEAQVAFALRPALFDPRHRGRLGELRALCRLYAGVMHILVNDDDIRSLQDLRGRTIYVGDLDSGNRIVAKAILDAAGIEEGAYTDHHDTLAPDADAPDGEPQRIGFDDATQLLREGEIEVAFIAAGRPAAAVEDVLLESRTDEMPVRLLDLANDAETVSRLTEPEGDYGEYRLKKESIPARFYPGQPDRVQTIQWDSYLLCREDLPARDAHAILDTIFWNIRQLLEAHTKAEDIKLRLAFSPWTDSPGEPMNLELAEASTWKLIEPHDGVRDFLAAKRDTLFILTGSLAGKYYDRGLTIQNALERANIPAHVMHTDGSLENAESLAITTEPDKRYQALAILQLGTALASLHGRPDRLYGIPADDFEFPSIAGLRRIATFDEEKLHIIYRHDQEDSKTSAVEVLRRLAKEDPSSICFGPKLSGTQLVMKGLLYEADIELADPVVASVPEMIRRLSNEGDLRIGCLMSYAPDDSISALLDDENIRLLGIDSRTRQKLISDLVVFEPATIEESVYGTD